MQISRLAEILRQMYDSAPAGEKALAFHLFGIKYASEIGSATNEIVKSAGFNVTWGTEVRKGIRLSQHVKLK